MERDELVALGRKKAQLEAFRRGKPIPHASDARASDVAASRHAKEAASLDEERLAVASRTSFDTNVSARGPSTSAGPSESTSTRLVPSSHRTFTDARSLQDLIDNLTREKFQLERGLQSQRTLLDALAEENASLAQAWNQQAAHRERWHAVQASLDDQRARAEAADARARRLADEVVALEDELRQVQASEERARRTGEAAERTSDALQRERKALLVRLRELAAGRGGAKDVRDVEGWCRGPMKDASTQTTPFRPGEARRRSIHPLASTDDGWVDEWHWEMVHAIHAMIERLGREKRADKHVPNAAPPSSDAKETEGSSIPSESDVEEVEEEEADPRHDDLQVRPLRQTHEELRLPASKRT
eukprot:jgi/Pico_ML_1/54387/g4743.t1